MSGRLALCVNRFPSSNWGWKCVSIVDVCHDYSPTKPVWRSGLKLRNVAQLQYPCTLLSIVFPAKSTPDKINEFNFAARLWILLNTSYSFLLDKNFPGSLLFIYSKDSFTFIMLVIKITWSNVNKDRQIDRWMDR